MEIRFITSVREYAKKVESLLLHKEACNNLMLGLIDRILKNRSDCHLGLVENDKGAIYAFMQTPPHNWILADVENVDKSVVQEIVRFLNNTDMDIPGVLGPDLYASYFVKEWKAITGKKANIHMNELIYQLDEVKITPISGGMLVPATEKQYNLLVKWLICFGQEANEDITKSYAETLARSFIKNQSAYLWKKNGRFVSMANRSRTTKHGATINAVYTPDAYKRNGYATDLVASLSTQFLEEGYQFCSLYTDKSNSTSNHIYQMIGYYEVGSSTVYSME
ncbi:GNAT family N-acetyltransferase [Virgibacillus halodenitrificans]|uniref:GNAT family N-acetyltransferase n=1 Tax=Virgibacillus halodenitrificans TaxID=1482 RepID=A0ABR7VSA4_VIRHA|nr:GNAT family N-acetyltransferase [Virgibacillus halodenitrificans]MBD1223447.1 GNAT family N-acetyltransferase [Virgibacillus halodenitrificans]